ncbi:hypothetical protein F751_3021 [Auxenochlorella protothecoides]|uniref:Uncharacterized protein n=1 Tax=Auxenochlorella protothecoides TaxID=3075 RepID=A0A087SI58_AUXPR|nr:hypothetical protein F751_3021 [Auxenochlorella protothecoides]KFM25412.1 hypothetical protein F751_3021 [Auxenochlorella protothecoides]
MTGARPASSRTLSGMGAPGPSDPGMPVGMRPPSAISRCCAGGGAMFSATPGV